MGRVKVAATLEATEVLAAQWSVGATAPDFPKKSDPEWPEIYAWVQFWKDKRLIANIFDRNV